MKCPLPLTTIFTIVSLFPLALSSAQSKDSPPESGVIPGKYIVVLKAGAVRAATAARHGVRPDHVYARVLNGFAGTIPPGRLGSLLADPDVAWVEPDRVATILGKRSISSPPPGEITPTGIARIGVPNTAEDFSSVGIAIIDTGIDLDHPDLNVVGNVSFVSGAATGDDDHGHGSHVAGIAAAKYNAIGVRGVAPNASLYAVKVLDRNGSGAYSAIIAGVNWVAERASTIQVANLSLGGPSSDALNAAVSGAVTAGVAVCVAAGNSATDARFTSPASCPQAFAVSAIADSDGECGGRGRRTSYGRDDTFATFSNFGPYVHIAAPGVDIYSTYRDGGYATMSGTSMASPHVAGAAARCLFKHPGTQPGGVYNSLIAAGTPQADPCGFSGDPDSLKEPLLNVSGL